MWLRMAVCALAAVDAAAQKPVPPAEPPAYFDEPQFIAAGVEDAANRGGHGSDVRVRAGDALAKATASLGSAGSAGASEESLRDALARDPNNAGLHHTLARVEEKLGKPLEALQEYQRAAELNPSELHLFDLGAELLIHRAPEQASAVLTRGAALYPRSVRMLLGLGAAEYSRGSYDDACKYLFRAIDLNPGDVQPYLFLGQMQASPVGQANGYAERMLEFVKRHPENAWANYYRAVSLRGQDSGMAMSLLEKAVRLDPRLGAAWLELGVFYADGGDDAKAIHSWLAAADAGPHMDEAHYRLAQAYRRTGQLDRAKGELAVYEEMKKRAAEADERERAGIKQFVFKLRDADQK
jgi:Tfp pilus assembly protein PilF